MIIQGGEIIAFKAGETTVGVYGELSGLPELTGSMLATRLIPLAYTWFTVRLKSRFWAKPRDCKAFAPIVK